ncbi:MAG: PDZ domain-containing protein [Marinicella pacifica]
MFQILSRQTIQIISLCVLSLFSGSILAQNSDKGTALLRYADIHKNQVTFVYAGDIYIADINQGEAKRLTSDKGFEVFPKFSRDGQRIAFSAEYSGTRQVYVMNKDGSDLKQLTWYNDVGPMPPRGGYDYRILDWSADDKNVLVRANRLPWGERMGQPHWIPVDGGMEQPLPVPETGGGMLSPDGTKYVYTPIDREFRTWKRYRGGRAQNVWVYDLENDTSEQLTTHRATDHQPVWVGDDIYFISDRDYRLNLYRYNPDGDPVKVTHHDKYDSLWASAGPEAIVYENGGYLWRFDPKTQDTQQLTIDITTNQENLMAQYKNVADYIESGDISPDGQRVVLGARGELFSVPAEHGEIRNISNTPKAREIATNWSPNGRYVAYLSDQSGEYDIYIYDIKSKQHKRITTDGQIWRFNPVWSPDSEKLAFSDKDHILWSVSIDGGKPKKLDSSSTNDIEHYRWSPDSRWLTYTKTENTGFSSIYVYDLNNNKAHKLSSAAYHDYEPVFDDSGQYLLFLSNRDYNLAFSAYEFNYLYVDATRLYAAQLTDDTPPIYPYQSDEVELSENTSKEKKDKKDRDEKIKVSIDFEGFNNRITALPVKAGNYNGLQTAGDKLFVLKGDDNGQSLLLVSLKKEDEPKTVSNNVNNYRLAAQGEKILLQQGDKLSIVEAKEGQDKNGQKLDLTNLSLKIDPQTEWQQMYTDAWRILRDWFYDPNMHGMDWEGIRAKYQPLVDAATHRSDLDYILGEIAGEMNSGHIYVNSGDMPKVKRQENGLLGATFEKDDSGYFKITSIFEGENWNKDRLSPLTEAGVKAEAGDYVLAVNGHSTKDVANIYELLEHQAKRTVTLTLNNKASTKGSWQANVQTITSEGQLRYLNWVNERRAMVDKLSDGRIGYVHLPNTAIEGNQELFKQMLPQIGKDALIIDDRYNGGGFIPDRMIELLSRKTLSYWKRRNLDVDSMATPLIAHDGPKVMLTNGLSSSGGDALPYFFRKMNLGKIIGTRTWGGLIGISGNPGLADGGSVIASTFRFMDTEGNWAVENEGVAPDIEVIDRPELVAQGQDPTLERAVEELLKDLKPNPRSTIQSPPEPTEF